MLSLCILTKYESFQPLLYISMALPHLYRAIGSKQLPMGGFPLIHFDSHPDLLIPKSLNPDEILNKTHVFNSISIENWIMPAAFAGHLSEIVWVKPPWVSTIPVGSEGFSIGVKKGTKEIRVTCSESYFISELLYAAPHELEKPKESRLTVCTLGKLIDKPSSANAPPPPPVALAVAAQKADNRAELAVEPAQTDSGEGRKSPRATEFTEKQHEKEEVEEKTGDSEEMIGKQSGGPSSSSTSDQPPKDSTSEAQHTEDIIRDVVNRLNAAGAPYALDIDLDFFSTKNPFLLEVGERTLEILKALYYFKMPEWKTQEDLLAVMESRRRQLANLESLLQEAQEGPKTDKESDSTERYLKAKEALHEYRQFLQSKGNGKPVDLSKRDAGPSSLSEAAFLHEVGCTCDETPLPHHISSLEQIDHLVEETAIFLKQFPKPAIVTIARSSFDDYCPQHQVDMIQSKILEMLENVFGSLDVKIDYEDVLDE